MKFKKYHSLENHYQGKYLSMFVNLYPEVKEIDYIISEKIHGANAQVCISKNEYKVGKRTSFITEDKDMKGLVDYVNRELTNTIKEIQDNINGEDVIILYGEWFGKGIQKGVDYGEGKHLRFFDFAINEELQPQELFLDFSNEFKLPLVPYLGLITGLDVALGYDSKFKSKVYEEAEGDNICEGIVIKPYKKNYFSPQGSLFYIKKKNEEFIEKQKQPKPINVAELGEIGRLQEIFKTYINKNRVDSVMSKYGEISDKKEISNYIKYVLEDAKEDFLKDNDISLIENKDIRAIYNVGNTVFNLIKEYL